MRLFFFNDTATTEIYTLSLHDALPIARLGLINALQSIAFAACTCMQCCVMVESFVVLGGSGRHEMERRGRCGKSFVQCIRAAAGSYMGLDRKSTRLNSSHLVISYAVF